MNQAQIHNKAFSLCTKGYRIATRPGKNKGEYTAYQIRLEDDTQNAELFGNLKKAIPENISEQIESINRPHHCIFVAGEDFNLAAGIASFVHISHNTGRLTHLSYLGQTDQEIIAGLFPPAATLGHYQGGGTLFISGLEKEHQFVFKRLLGYLREIDTQRLLGYLIIHVKNTDAIPPELVNISDVINLEPEKQAGISVTEKNQAIPREIHYDDRAGILFTGETQVDLTPTEKVFFEYIWDKRAACVDDVIEHMTTFDEFNNTQWSRSYFDKTKAEINRKGKSLGVENLIKNTNKGKGKYSLSMKAKPKTFKP